MSDQTSSDLQEVKEIGTAKFCIHKKELNHVVSQIATLVDEATFEIDPEGIKFRGMDPSHVALIDVDMPAAIFESFEVESTEKVGVRIGELLKILKNFEKDERIRFEVGVDHMLHLVGETFKTSVRLIESSASSTPLPKLNFDANIRLSRGTLKKLKGIQTVSEYITFNYDTADNSFTASGKGDTGEAELKVTEFENNSQASAKATFSLDYLVKIWNNIIRDLVMNVKFEYSTKMPLRIEYNLVGRVSFYLAPRVQD